LNPSVLSAVLAAGTRQVFAAGEFVLITIFNDDPESGFVFYQQLARALGNRLLQIYDTVSECGRSGVAHSA
jgi:hypothetical protein